MADNGSVVRNVVGGVLILAIGGLLLFLASVVFGPPNVAGPWDCVTFTETDAVDTEHYEQGFVLHSTTLDQRDSDVTGSDEKYAEFSRIPERDSGRNAKSLPRTERTRGTISGTIRSGYIIGRSRVLLRIDDETSATRTYEMVVDGDRMYGNFRSSVANQRGRVTCRRDDFNLDGSVADIRQRLQREIAVEAE